MQIEVIVRHKIKSGGFGDGRQDGEVERGRSAECRVLVLANSSAAPLHRLIQAHLGRGLDAGASHPTTASVRHRAPRNHKNLSPLPEHHVSLKHVSE